MSIFIVCNKREEGKKREKNDAGNRWMDKCTDREDFHPLFNTYSQEKEEKKKKRRAKCLPKP
jgi:hypothetical protein